MCVIKIKAADNKKVYLRTEEVVSLEKHGFVNIDGKGDVDQVIVNFKNGNTITIIQDIDILSGIIFKR